MKSSKPCPCGSKKLYEACCGVFISGLTHAPTPETLMRSRYTAYSQANIDYIAQTMCGPAAVSFDPVDSKKWAKSIKWVRLEVLSTSIDANHGSVTFKAYFTQKNKPRVLEEHSLFECIEGKWYYVGMEAP